MYTFEKAAVAKDFNIESSLLCTIREDVAYNDVIVPGKLKFLFGAPTHMTKDFTQQYQYLIKATDENGASLILDAHYGPSGSEISGFQDKKSQAAANELAAAIIQTKETADYEFDGYYMDFWLKVHQGIQNGVPYSEQETMTMEEFEEVSTSPELSKIY